MPTRGDVRDTFERIAEHFAETRHHPWPEVEAFLEGRDGSLGLDLGCGNGRHAALLAERTDRVLALDASRALLGAARERCPTAGFVQADAATSPVATDAVALALYVATLHHLPSDAARRASLDDLARALAPGAPALVSAWSTAADRFDDPASGERTVDWTLPGGETVPRYYFVFAPGDFDALLADSDLTVERTWVSSGNCYAVVKG